MALTSRAGLLGSMVNPGLDEACRRVERKVDGEEANEKGERSALG
jgi:hypothetical protein